MDKKIGVGELVKGVKRLISLPEIYSKIETMIANGQYSNREFGKVISQDPALTVRLLQIVNSALFNFGGRVDTVSRAITLVGHDELKMLVVASSSAKIFGNFPTKLIDAVQLWRYSLLVGITCRLLAMKCNVLHPERLFIAGLLHDIGHLVIYSRLPEQSEEIIRQSADKPGYSRKIEQAILGFDYTDVNFQLAREWHFPESLQIALKYHHEPEQTSSYQLESALLHIGKNIALLEFNEEALGHISDFAWQASGLDESIVDEIQINASVQFSEALELILPH